jgi:Predicted membrane protein (DUF2142)
MAVVATQHRPRQPADRPVSAERRVRITLIAGVALIALALAATLAQAPARVLHSNAVAPDFRLADVSSNGARLCQAGELLPRGTSALRFSLLSVIAPSITVSASSGTRVLTAGRRAAGWMTGSGETIPVRALSRSYSNVTVCFTLGDLTGETVSILGQTAPPATAARGGATHGTLAPLGGRIRVDYLSAGQRSWWSRAGAIVGRIGRGRAWGGAWTLLLILLPTAAMSGLALWSMWRAPGPRGALVCALVALLSAGAWANLSPPFQAIDEPDHFAYAQLLAETGRLPNYRPRAQYSSEEALALRDLGHFVARRQPQNRLTYTAAQLRQLRLDLAAHPSRVGSGLAGTARSEPPLYYALETIPYRIAAGATVLWRLQAMRLFSALLAGVTALFAYLFVREALPREPWAWTVGGLGVALQPLLGEISGSVNPDALLYAISAALFYCLARGFRHGLTRRLALATGATIALGLLSKLNFIGLLPGAAAGLALLIAAAWRRSGRPLWRPLALALVATALPFGLYLLLSGLAHRFTSMLTGSLLPGGAHSTVGGELSYVWQLYLPRLPGMGDDFPGILTTRTIWLNGLTGLYGWIDTTFPSWVYNLALIPITLIAALCLNALRNNTHALRQRAGELAVYLSIALGVMALVGAASYVTFTQHAGSYEQVRYLFPLLAPLGAVLALAARGAGARWGPVAGAAIVVLILAHAIFSQLLLVTRYYG